MREKGIEREQAMDSVRLQRMIDVCDTKENTALYLLQEWNYEPQVDKKGKCLMLQVSSSSTDPVVQTSTVHVFVSPSIPPSLSLSLSEHFFWVVPLSLLFLDGIWLRAFYGGTERKTDYCLTLSGREMNGGAS